MSTSKNPLRVLIVTPLGKGGMGGIDRIMDAVAERIAAVPPPDLEIRFGVTRGQGHIAISPLLVAKVIASVFGRPQHEGRPDVVHINLSSHGSTIRKLAVSRVLRALRIPYVLHLHGSEFREYWNSAGDVLSARIHAMFAGAASIIVLGHVWHEYIRVGVPEAAGRIRILPNATLRGPDRALHQSHNVIILFLGHVGPRKGVPQLVEALRRLKDRENWTAVIAGNGAVDETRQDLAKLGLGDRVTVPGWVGPDDVSRWLRAAAILVLPSFGENLPMSVIEGMAYGLAVVTTPVGAMEDIIHDGVTGLLVPPGDAAALATALDRLLADPGLLERLGTRAQAFHREHLEIGGYVNRLVDIWRSVA